MEFFTNINFNQELIENEYCTITYSGKLFQNNSDLVSIVYGYGENWTHTTEQKMTKTENGFVVDIKLLGDFNLFNFCFKNSNNEWDNNDCQNYVLPITKLPEIDSFIINENIIDEIVNNLVENDLSKIELEESNSVNKFEENITEIDDNFDIVDDTIENSESTSDVQEQSNDFNVNSLINEILSPIVSSSVFEENNLEDLKKQSQEAHIEEKNVEEINTEKLDITEDNVEKSEVIEENIENKNVVEPDVEEAIENIDAFEASIEESNIVNEIEESDKINDEKIDSEELPSFVKFEVIENKNSINESIQNSDDNENVFFDDSLVQDFEINETITLDNKSTNNIEVNEDFFFDDSPIQEAIFNDNIDIKETIDNANINFSENVEDLKEDSYLDKKIDSLISDLYKNAEEFSNTFKQNDFSSNSEPIENSIENIDTSSLNNNSVTNNIQNNPRVFDIIESINAEIEQMYSNIEKEENSDLSNNDSILKENSSNAQLSDIQEDNTLSLEDNDEESLMDVLNNDDSQTSLIKVNTKDNYIVSVRSLTKFYLFKKKIKLAFYKIFHVIPRLLNRNFNEDNDK